MSEGSTTDSKGGQSSNNSGTRQVWVNGVKHTLDRDETYTPADLIERAGDDPSDHNLRALKGRSGDEVYIFSEGEEDDPIDFSQQHRKFFETLADGDVYI